MYDGQRIYSSRARAKFVEGTVSNEQRKTHDCTLHANGPSLYVEVKNPSLLGLGPSAVVSGDTKIYHDHETQLSFIEWLSWWMP